jgi:hypothetical protein
MIRINAEILRQAKQQGHNISKICENALKQKINPENNQFFGEAFFPKKVFWCSGRDSNPGLRLERPKYLARLYYRSLSEQHANLVFFRFNLSPPRMISSPKRECRRLPSPRQR